MVPVFGLPSLSPLTNNRTIVVMYRGPYFLMKYFGPSGTFTVSVSKLNGMLLSQFSRLLGLIEKLNFLFSDKNEKDDKEGKKDEGDKKKRSWITEKWQKIIKSNFFQKTLGFLKSLATVNFITQLLTFLILLRMGIFQTFIPFIVSSYSQVKFY